MNWGRNISGIRGGSSGTLKEYERNLLQENAGRCMEFGRKMGEAYLRNVGGV